VLIVLIPTVGPWEAAAYLGFGGFNACPAPWVHVAYAREAPRHEIAGRNAGVRESFTEADFAEADSCSNSKTGVYAPRSFIRSFRHPAQFQPHSGRHLPMLPKRSFKSWKGSIPHEAIAEQIEPLTASVRAYYPFRRVRRLFRP
jgi:hypothetical protein